MVVYSLEVRVATKPPAGNLIAYHSKTFVWSIF